MGTHEEFAIRLSSGRTFQLREGVRLSAEDILDVRTSAADHAFAEVVRNPREQAVLGLRNLSSQAWSAIGPSGGQKQLEPGKSLKLIGGTTINFGSFGGTIREGSSRFSLSLTPGRVIPLTAGVRLTTNDLLGMGTSSSARLIAEVTRNPKDPTILGLKNLSSQGWSATGPSGGQRHVDPGKSVKLGAGTTINFGAVEGEIQHVTSDPQFTKSYIIAFLATALIVLTVGAWFTLHRNAEQTSPVAQGASPSTVTSPAPPADNSAATADLEKITKDPATAALAAELAAKFAELPSWGTNE